ncbi:MAG: hypothetical protein GY711_24890 [bacterium]|nr:hypothetical protein [bacterium]
MAAVLVDEVAWDGYDTFYDELRELQVKLRRYVTILGAIAGAVESPDVESRTDDDQL